jgi:hypothetical protein
MDEQGSARMEALRRILLLALLAIAVACAWLKPLDDMAGAQAQAGFKRAVASFATARALNAVISVVQGTELSVQPLGVGITLTPGQMLDPLNDLVERFADLMLMASVAFGVQLLLLEMGVHWGMSLLLSLAAAGWAWQTWRSKRPPALLTRVLVALLLVRFIVPLAGMASDVVYRGFMQEQYAAGQQGIEQASKAIGALAPDGGAADKKWWQLDRHIEQLGATIDKTVEHAIRLIVVFLLQTLILPLVVFWILLRTGRMLSVPGAGS